MANADVLARAREHAAAGRWEEARALLQGVAAGDIEADFLLARAEETLGDLTAARDRLVRLRGRLPAPSPALELQAGLIHQRLGEIAPAIRALGEAFRLRPDWNDAGLLLNLALLHTQAGDAAGAIGSLVRALGAQASDATTWMRIGHLLGEHGRHAEADAALSRAAALDPGAPAIETLRATVKQELGDEEGALRALEAARRRDPDDLRVAISERLLLPQTYGSVEDVERWRTRYADGLDELSRDRDRWMPRAADVFSLDRGNFLLAYQGEDDRALQERYSALLAAFASHAAPHLAEPIPRASRDGRRVRVGFLGSLFRESTAGFYFERWVTGLDAGRFERFVYHTAPVSDALTQRVAAAAEHFHAERLDNRALAELVRAHDLDVLVYPEVGMSSVTYLLAALRLARVQCAGWGHPVTTGSSAMDYFFTCGAMEPADAQAHYREPLVALPGIGVEYAMPAAHPPAPRSQFGLADDARVYICPQSLFKIHPEMDDVFARVASEDSRAVLVFFQAPARAVTERLAARIGRAFERQGVAPRGQVKFLPRLPGALFRSALAASDVVIDTLRWSGGNTSLDAFAAGVPVVTLEGRFMRGRQTAAMLRMMGLETLVAPDAEGLARLALAIACDRERNAGLRSEVRARRDVLFGRSECTLAFQEALLRLGGATR